MTIKWLDEERERLTDWRNVWGKLPLPIDAARLAALIAIAEAALKKAQETP